MRSRYVGLVMWISLQGCGSTPIEGTGAETGAGSTSATTSDEPTTSATTGSSGATSAGTSGEAETTGAPGSTTEAPPGSTSAEPPGSTSAEPPGTTSGPDETTSGGSTGATTACQEFVKIPLPVEEAELSGDWTLVESMLGEGTIVQLQNGVDGAVVFNVTVPCDDTWTLWVRTLDYHEYDTIYVQLDEAPDPPAIFEADCENDDTEAWMWKPLNWRVPDMACMYLEDPWTVDWGVGAHRVTFSYRPNESISVGRMFAVNDPNYAPMMGD